MILFESKFDLIGDIRKYFNLNLIWLVIFQSIQIEIWFKNYKKLFKSKYFDLTTIKSIQLENFQMPKTANCICLHDLLAHWQVWSWIDFKVWWLDVKTRYIEVGYFTIEKCTFHLKKLDWKDKFWKSFFFFWKGDLLE